MSLPSDFDQFLQTRFFDFAGITMTGQTVSIDFVFSTPLQVNRGEVWSELFLLANPGGLDGNPANTQHVVLGPGSSAHLIDENGNVLDVPMSDGQGGLTTAPVATRGVVLTDQGWAGAEVIAYPAPGTRVAGIHFDLVLPNNGQTLVPGSFSLKLDGTPVSSPGEATSGSPESGEPTDGSGGETTTEEPTSEAGEGGTATEPAGDPTSEPAAGEPTSEAGEGGSTTEPAGDPTSEPSGGGSAPAGESTSEPIAAESSNEPASNELPSSASSVVLLSSGTGGFVFTEFANLAGTVMNGQTLSVDFVFPRLFHMDGGPLWSELFLQTGPHNSGSAGDYPYDQYVVFSAGTRAYLKDENGVLIDAPMSDWQGGKTTSPGPALGVLLTERGWAGADIIGYPSGGQQVSGVHFDLVLPNTGQTLDVGRIALKVSGIEVGGSVQGGSAGGGSSNTSPEQQPSGGSTGSGASEEPSSGSPGETTESAPVAPVPGAVSVSSSFNDFVQLEFSNFAGVTMNGQVLPIDFTFSRLFAMQGGPLWSELFLQTGPHNPPNSNGDYPYDQYVVFGAGSRAYLFDQDGALIDAPMSDWQGGTTNSPGPTTGILLTDRGWAGAEMIAYPQPGSQVAGIRFELVLPNTGQTLDVGRIAVKLNGVAIGTEVVPPAVQPPTGPTPPSGQPSLPLISSLAVTDSTNSGATIHWSTGGTDTVVEYGTTTSYGQQAVPQSSAPGSYSAVISGLAPATTYHYRISSRAADGNIVSSEDNVFITGFAIPDGGGISRTTDGSGPLITGYGRVQLDSGTAPSGLLIFGNSQQGMLVNEAAVSANALMIGGRIPVEVSVDGLSRTAVAMANPSTEDATVQFDFRNAEGNIFRSGSFTLRGVAAICEPGALCNQLSRFLDEFPFDSGKGVSGVLSFTSTIPISVMAIRGFYNERTPGDFLLSNAPVFDASVGAVTDMSVIPHFVVGNGMKTEAVFINPTGNELRGVAYFMDSWGVPVSVDIAGNYTKELVYSIPPNGTQKFIIAGAIPSVASGSIWILPDGTPAPSAFTTITYKPGDITIAETTVPATMGNAFRMYAQLSASPAINTSLAIANASYWDGSVTLSLTDLDGNFVAANTLSLRSWGQIRGPVASLLPSLEGRPFQGILRITTDLSKISVVGFRERNNVRGDFLFTSIVPVPENGPPPRETVFPFPQLVNGEGFTTEIILFSGTVGSSSQGNLIFHRPDATPFILDIH